MTAPFGYEVDALSHCRQYASASLEKVCLQSTADWTVTPIAVPSLFHFRMSTFNEKRSMSA